MRFVRYLQHWLSGTGVCLQVTDFVPVMRPLRQWADTFPWAALVSAIEQSFATRFPKKTPRGRQPVPVRVLFALELLKHELGPPMRISAIGCGPTLPSCMLAASASIRSIRLKRTLSCPRPSASFVAASMRLSWMNSLPSKPLPPWRRAWSVRRISSSRLFPVNKGVSVSPMPRPCRKRKKNAGAHRRPHADVQPPRHGPPASSPGTPPGADKSHAVLWPPMPRTSSPFAL